MKTKFIIVILFFSILLLNNNSFAQRWHSVGRGGHFHRRYQSGIKMVRMHRFPRERVVIVSEKRFNPIPSLSVEYISFIYKGKNYFYSNGLFYDYYDNNYRLVTTPIGVRLSILPGGYYSIVIGGLPHYYYKGVYYKPVDNQFETVEPLVGTIVSDLPAENIPEVKINGKKYYELDNLLYKAIKTENGIQYEVVAKLGD
ncbi:MAG: DUF6515 family protein [Bacteroidetes bacterium]|nr:DUF6515 family protein [Bacteroidota bacterium]